MLFLLRLAFWILLVCLLLPGSHENNQHLMTSAGRTISDVRGFCLRNPEVCEDARITAAAMLTKLRSGAELIQAWLAKDETKNGEIEPNSPPLPDPGVKAAQPRIVPGWQDSLNPADKQMPWRGPAHL